MKEIKILMIDNIFLTVSGGDTHLLKVYEHWNLIPNIKVRLVIPETSKLLKTKNNISIIIEIMIIYATRIIKTCLTYLNNKFDLIVTSSHYPPDVMPAVLYSLMNPKAKIVVIMHGFFPEIPNRKLLRRIFSLLYNFFGLALVRRVADLIFVFNKHTRNLLVNAGVDHRKVFLTSNGVDVTDLTLENDEKLFDACFLGRLVENKGIPDLVKVWKLVCRVRKNAKLAVMGSGPLTELLIELMRRNDLVDNIIPLGWVLGDRKFGVLQRSKVFVFPSHLEGWAIAIAEAMACGLPVVAYDLPIYREVFEDKLITVPLGNVEAMAEKVIFLLENPEVAKKIGEEGREFVKRYDWSMVAERELSVIESLFKQRLR